MPNEPGNAVPQPPEQTQGDYQPEITNKPKKISKKVLILFFALVAIGLAELALIAVKIGDG